MLPNSILWAQSAPSNQTPPTPTPTQTTTPPPKTPTRSSDSKSNYYVPQTTIGDTDTVGGMALSTAGSGLIGCASGALAGLAAQGISSLFSLVGASTAVPVKEGSLEITQNCLNGAAYAVSHTLLAQLTNKTLNWVNSGFGGNPLYVKDTASFLKSISDEKVNSFLDTLDPQGKLFDGSIRSIITEQVSGVSDGYFDKLSAGDFIYEYKSTGGKVSYCKDDYQSRYAADDAACLKTPEDPNDASIDTVGPCRVQVQMKYDEVAKKNCVGKGLKDYGDFQQNFTNGGWDYFLNSVSHDDNNPIGALFKASDTLSSQIAQQQQDTKDQLQRNGGFLDMKICAQYKTYTAGDPGASDPKCLKYETVTPGSIISKLTADTTGSPQQQLQQADQINEVLQSFFSTLLNNFLQRGLSGIGRSGDKTYSSGTGGVGDNVVYGADGSVLSGVNDGIGKTQQPYDTSTFDISRPQEIRAVLQAQKDFVSAAQDTITAVKYTTARLGQLDYNIPGPNSDWQSGLNGNFQSFASAIGAASKDQPSTFVKILFPLFSGIFASNNKILPKYYLNDKTTGQQIEAAYPYVIAPYDETDKYTNEYNGNPASRFAETYSVTSLGNFFSSVFTTPVDQDNAFGFTIDAVAQTQSLVPFAQNALAIEESYTQYIKSTSDAINELESIRKEVNSIVTTAKARYINEQKAAGTPVNLTCLNDAYVIDTSPLTTRPTNPATVAQQQVVNYSDASKAYFYDNLRK